jgi:hypothetical protein
MPSSWTIHWWSFTYPEERAPESSGQAVRGRCLAVGRYTDDPGSSSLSLHAGNPLPKSAAINQPNVDLSTVYCK